MTHLPKICFDPTNYSFLLTNTQELQISASITCGGALGSKSSRSACRLCTIDLLLEHILLHVCHAFVWRNTAPAQRAYRRKQRAIDNVAGPCAEFATLCLFESYRAIRLCPMANFDFVSDPLRFALHRHKTKHVTFSVILDSDLTVA